MNQSRTLGRLAVAGARQLHGTKTLNVQNSLVLRSSGKPIPYDNSHIPKLREKQAKFQIDDDVPVFLKGGPLDKVLYYTTMGLCVVSAGLGFEFMYQCYFDKKLFDFEE